jgi:hypothetical protein
MEKASKFLHKESLTVPPNQILIPLNMWRIFRRESLGLRSVMKVFQANNCAGPIESNP